MSSHSSTCRTAKVAEWPQAIQLKVSDIARIPIPMMAIAERLRGLTLLAPEVTIASAHGVPAFVGEPAWARHTVLELRDRGIWGRWG
jgi:hypothetical protein